MILIIKSKQSPPVYAPKNMYACRRGRVVNWVIFRLMLLIICHFSTLKHQTETVAQTNEDPH